MPFKRQWRRPDLRNHRKLVIVDGKVAHTGSQNLTDRSYNKKKNIERGLQWQELMMRVTGPAVRELEAVFATDWYAETDELLSLDPSPVTSWTATARRSTCRCCRADRLRQRQQRSSCSRR